MAEERLQKIMAAAGVASRRACEKLITAGRVQVDGVTVTELGAKADPAVARISIDGRPLLLPETFTYLKAYKPRGMLSDTGGDARGRRNISELLPAGSDRIFPVGRLDLKSEGLLLLTNDGSLAHKLTHPRYEHPKTYYVLVERKPGERALQRLRKGVTLPEYRTAPAQVRVVEQLPQRLHLDYGRVEGVWLEIILREGKKRQIRHMTAAVGYPTLRLVRWAIGPLTLGDLTAGETQALNDSEVRALRDMVKQRARRES
ncbi:MAG: rRNA pseudouridine synthase [Caldilineaceae bacterium]|nr:rRNA pseudouridine synthase [Caldilineaceae bacterium]